MNTNRTRASGHDDLAVAPELEGLVTEDKPDGPGAAMLISAGIGIFVLGLFTVLAEASVGIKDWLQTFEMGLGVGPLAGKVALGTLAYFVSLGGLWALWRHKDVDLRRAFIIGCILGALGALMTFPTFFQLFTAE